MPAPPFAHLHVHSHYSLLDGVIPIPALVRAAKDRGMKALALTDHGNLFGAVEFFQTCKQEGIKPIIGMEAYITDGSRFDRRRDTPGNNFFHLVLLARNEEGYRNLVRLSSSAYTEGFYYKPRIDHELLAKHARGLIGLSACLSSEVNRALLLGAGDKARAAARRYSQIFGHDHFFLEIQDHGLPEQKRVLEQVPALARELGLPIVATNDIHYLNPDDSRSHEVHLCINTGATMEDSDRLCLDSNQFHFRTADEMARIFADYPGAVATAGEIAALIDFELDTKANHLPVFHPGATASDAVAEGPELAASNLALFRSLLEEGFAARYPNPPEECRRRLEYEIEMIEKMGFVSYFLIVWDFIRFAREQRIPVGPGRGSAVGSIVAYCLGITDVDPLRYDLIFERFLNSDRISLPDIDIDFCRDGRERVIQYVREKYGSDRVCQIVTFGTMAARQVIRDVGRVLRIPLGEVDGIAKTIPKTLDITLAAAIEQEPELKALSQDARYQELFSIALRLEGLNRNCSTHAAGVVISDAPLTEIVPLCRNKGEITTQYTMEALESIGLLKMDFLGLNALTILDRALDNIESESGRRLALEEIPLDDRKTYELLASANTTAIFQLESSGMRELLRRLRPDRFEELIAALALFRPGPLGSGMEKVFCDRKHAREKISYLHPSLASILGETNGVILYQEQVMRIAHDLAGFSMNEADSLRKAMGKKKPEILARFKDQFTEGARLREIPPHIAREIFEQIEHFAKYGFNKSHSTAYAVISYRVAYLKANFPAELMAAALSCEIGAMDKIVELIAECRRMGISVHPPRINSSAANFTVRNGEIHYGLVALKGVGEKAAEDIVSARDAGGPFRTLYDLTRRVDLRTVNKAVLDQLIGAGACDELCASRAALSAAVAEAMEEGNRLRAEERAGQLSLFAEGAEPAGATRHDYPNVPEWTESERLAAELGSLGFYLSGHPLAQYEPDIQPFRTHMVAELAESADATKVTLGVRIAKVRLRQTKKGEPMALVTVEDQSGSVEVVVFPSIYRSEQAMIKEEAILLVQGETETRDDRLSLRADTLIPLERALERCGRLIEVAFDAERTSEDELFRLKEVAQRHPGELPLALSFRSGGGERWVVRTEVRLSVAATRDMLAELRELVGSERVLVCRG
ncbi:MAG: DNA polymerase III subunit alpha [Planctomycetes bacterium]|nr:DNA polymerase III subunit alpha [Planctomycetota bacterium]